MDTRNITITLDIHTLEELKNYAVAIGISIEEFIEDVVVEFIRFQMSEMDEIYLNDDGASWFVPKD